jgi:Arc/MetJ family transcription regulator
LTLPNKSSIISRISIGAGMRANVNLDDTLLTEAMKISGMSTKTAVLNMALKEYLRKNNLKKILKYRGKNIWEGDLNEMRKAR